MAASTVLRGGTVYDGTGGEPRTADVLLRGDRLAAVGEVGRVEGASEIDARGLAVAPGFINVLSHAYASLIADGRSQSDIRQGVTLEVFGEFIPAPLTDALRAEYARHQVDIHYEMPWSTVGGFLDHLVARGISPNVASFVPAAAVRACVVGHADRRPTADELERMRALVREAMAEGALGLASALIYVPGTFADTAELSALADVAGAQGGMYISHIRNESDRLLEAIDELVTIAREARLPAEIYHLKQAGRRNWSKLDTAIAAIEAARAEGLQITADMYPYVAGATGLDAAMPPWVQEGGLGQWVSRLRDGMVRARVAREMRAPASGWENLFHIAGPENMKLVEFKDPSLKPLTGKTLAEVAALRGVAPEEAAMDLVAEDQSRVETVYFFMSEDNVRRQIALPWMSFGSDAASLAPEGVFLRSLPHPRAYGTFARVLGRYVRDERAITLAEAVRRLTSLPATNLGLGRRGVLAAGHAADVVVFDPARVRDHATFDDPHRFATGVAHVFVNGVQVLRDGEHTGALPGRVLRRARPRRAGAPSARRAARGRGGRAPPPAGR